MEGKNEKRPPDPGHGSGAVDSILNMPPSHTDPNGSYTGRPQDPDEVPVQDADDLSQGGANR